MQRIFLKCVMLLCQKCFFHFYVFALCSCGFTCLKLCLEQSHIDWLIFQHFPQLISLQKKALSCCILVFLSIKKPSISRKSPITAQPYRFPYCNVRGIGRKTYSLWLHEHDLITLFYDWNWAYIKDLFTYYNSLNSFVKYLRKFIPLAQVVHDTV